MKSYNITIIEPWSNREVRHLDVPASQLKDVDGETWFTGYNEPIEVITAELVSEESQLQPKPHTLQNGEQQVSKLLNTIYEEMGVVCLLGALIIYPLAFMFGVCILAHALLHWYPW